jgi:RimJ/RimL family protein N-acetyltransferase
MRIETPRLALRSWTLNDVAPYARIVADPEVMRHVGTGAVQSPRQAEEFVRRMRALEASRGWILWAVELMQSCELAGFCGYGTLDGRLDFGWRLARKFWGQGFGTEAAAAALQHGVARYGLTDIRAVAYEKNRGSIRIMEKIGMNFESAATRHGRPVVIYIHRPGPN